ncbi:hypothetical protein ABZ840_32500 [Streptomyces sp. NPDC047117]|uniref:hypothetical protein n=1 Tax=unclassified Streptomyces TaxID=2593676 RepID=UPI00340309B4
MSAQVPVCNHRVYEVVIVFLLSVITGLTAGVLLSLLGTPPVSAVAAGAAAFAATFGLGMTAVAYIKKQDN